MGNKYESELNFWRGIVGKPETKEGVSDGRTLAHLLLPADYFAGKRVLEIGCGPLAHALDFTDCEIVGLDPLVSQYKAMGYRMDAFEYVEGYAEDMPFADGEFDAVISFNALDHVDDFEATCAEIERVCSGIIRVELHYHEAWECEPLELNDERVRAAFSPAVTKLIERPFGETFFPGHPDSPSYSGTVALWSNDPTLVYP